MDPQPRPHPGDSPSADNRVATSRRRLLLVTGDDAVVAAARAQLSTLARFALAVDRSRTLGDSQRLLDKRDYAGALIDTRLLDDVATLRPFGARGVAVVLLAGNEGELATREEVAGYALRDSLDHTLAPIAYAVLGGMRRESALERERDAADELMRTCSEFLANMSHESRTPLHTITGMNELLVGTDLDAEQSEYSSSIGFAAHTLLSLINDILDFSKIESGHLELESIDMDLHVVVEEAVELVSLEVHNKGLEIASCLGGGVPHLLRGDPVRLRQVLVNLISNAVKFTEAGEIAIEAAVESGRPDGVTIRCTVRDSGIGIPADRQQALFGAFTQADSSTTRKYGGTGLGLSISQQLVSQMGGEIGVESEVGHGSTFWFTARFGVQEVARRFSGLGDQFFEGLRVMVVDDNATACGYVVSQLAEWGCEVTGVPSGEEALRMLRESAAAGAPFALALVDLKMPGIDGWHLGSEVHADETLTPTLVLMTPVGMSGDEAKIKLLGWFDGYLPKPVRKAQLLDTVVRLVRAAHIGAADWADELEELPAQQAVDDAAARVSGGYRVLAAEDHEVNRSDCLRPFSVASATTWWWRTMGKKRSTPGSAASSTSFCSTSRCPS